MTRLFFTGFDGGALSLNNGAGLFVTAPFYSTNVHSAGGYSIKWDISSSTGGYYEWTNGSIGITFVTGRVYYLRAYVRFDTFPSTRTIGTLFIGGSSDFISIDLHTDHKLYLRDRVNGADVGSPTAAISTGVFYMLELAIQINTGSNDDYAEARLNGVSFASSTTLNLGTTAPTFFDANGSVGGADTYVIYYDDLALNDNQGSVNNSWCGEEYMVLLKPVSDNARGTNWTGGAGGTTNLWNAVDNTPPVGVDNASATDTSQIKNEASDTTGNYDANLMDYLTAGIGASDTINAVQGLWNIGCSSSTSTGGATQIVSNPAEGSETSINFAAGGAVGTFPSNWKSQFNSIIESPTVTKGTQPVLRIGKRQATTRIGHCDFMGLMVSYTPVTSVIFRRTDSDRIGSRN